MGIYGFNSIVLEAISALQRSGVKPRRSIELLIFCAAMAGAGLAFLWFNAHPAQVFMGDTGSLPLGALLAPQGEAARMVAALVRTNPPAGTSPATTTWERLS